MKPSESSAAQIRVLIVLAVLCAVSALVAADYSHYPDWWFERGVIATNPATGAYAVPDDYSVLTQGQLKNLATAAYDEMEDKLASVGGAGPAIEAMVKGWFELDGAGGFLIQNGQRVPKIGGSTDPNAVVNLGQLKNVSKPFYDRLAEVGLGDIYVWPLDQGDNYAAVNIGQVKNLFNIDFDRDSDGDGLSDAAELAAGTQTANPDSDGDGIPDGWEVANGLNPNNASDASADADGDGLSNLEEFNAGTNPNNPDTDNDGFSDKTEADNGTAPSDPSNYPIIWMKTFREASCLQPVYDDIEEEWIEGEIYDYLYDPFVEYTTPLAGPPISLNSLAPVFSFPSTPKGVRYPYDAPPDATANAPYYLIHDGMVSEEQGWLVRDFPSPIPIQRTYIAVTEREIDEVPQPLTFRIVTVTIPANQAFSNPVIASAPLTIAASHGEEGAFERLLPVEFKTYPDTELGPDKAHKRNLPHLAAYDVHYGKEWRKCVSKVWETSPTLNLIDYLEGADDPSKRTLFEQNLKWKVNGAEQSSHELNYGGEAADDEHQHFFVEVLSKSGGETIDRLIITVIPRSTKTAFDTWYAAESGDKGWLQFLPSLYKQLGVGNSDPEPASCSPQKWNTPSPLNGSFYHPGSAFEMRSLPAYRSPYDPSFSLLYGHQACYDDKGSLVRNGVGAGSADREVPLTSGGSATGHRDKDVRPFIRAAQIDGNPVQANSHFAPTNLDHPMLYKGGYISHYLEVRPTFANAKPELAPGTCP